MMYESYILVKHANFDYMGVMLMPVFERRKYLDILMEENDKIKQAREKEANRAKAKRS